MTWARRVLFGIVCLLAIGMDGLGQLRTIAAGPSSATVAILRNPKLTGVTRPGDFNGDGILDVVGITPATATTAPQVAVALGKGDGTFAAPIRANFNGEVMDVDDVNGDGKLDLLVVAASSSPSLFVAFGNGDGTFTTVRTVVNYGVRFARSVDIDGDGDKDVLVANGTDIEIITRNAAGIYDGITSVGYAPDPRAVAIGDFNHDGLLDFAVTNFGYNSVTIFHNQGQLAFGAADITITPGFLGGIAAADLNGDGKLDLAIVVADGGDSDTHWDSGRAAVLMGNGDGTFRAPVSYDVARGAWEIVIGDFTRDGILDIATANRSSLYVDAACNPLQTWDSVSILPGKGDGTFTAPSNFSIGNQMKPTDPVTDRNTVVSLMTGDLNGDHQSDLIVSNGTLFLNKATDPNWAPKVNAGPDQTINDGTFVHLYASASDVDQDMLTYAWFDSGGQSIPPGPSPCFTANTDGIHTYTVVVDDGNGHSASDSVVVDFGGSTPPPAPPAVSITAPTGGEILDEATAYTIRWNSSSGARLNGLTVRLSTDDGGHWQVIGDCVPLPATATSCTWNSVEPVTDTARISVTIGDEAGRSATSTSGRFAVRAKPGTPLNYGWLHSDVGNVGAAGSASHDGFVWNGQGITASGSGADIAGYEDAFHFVWQQLSGDFSIDTRVSSLQTGSPGAKAGLMIRAGATDAASPYAAIFLSASAGVAYQRRTTEGDVTIGVAGPALAAPVWLRLTRRGTTIAAWYRKSPTDVWTVLGADTIATLGGSVAVGLAVTSRQDGQLGTAKFEGVYYQNAPDFQLSSHGGATGSLGFDGTNYTFRASGSDIWGTGDSFMFASIPIGTNEQITMRVRSVGNTDPWAKAGGMIRESGAAGSRHADAIVSPGKGVAMQYRNATGGASASAVQINGAAPIWLKLRRSEPAQPTAVGGFMSWYSKDGVIWHVLGSVNFTTTHDAVIGIALTSHKTGVQTTAIIDDVRIER